jgi:hypothetical protein
MTDIEARIEELARMAYEATMGPHHFSWKMVKKAHREPWRRIARALYAEVLAKDAEIDRLTRERDEAYETADAHEKKWQSFCKAPLSDTGTCACSYDKPDDVCSHHSPKLKAAEARVAGLEGALREARNLLMNAQPKIADVIRKCEYASAQVVDSAIEHAMEVMSAALGRDASGVANDVIGPSSTAGVGIAAALEAKAQEARDADQ